MLSQAGARPAKNSTARLWWKLDALHTEPIRARPPQVARHFSGPQGTPDSPSFQSQVCLAQEAQAACARPKQAWCLLGRRGSEQAPPVAAEEGGGGLTGRPLPGRWPEACLPSPPSLRCLWWNSPMSALASDRATLSTLRVAQLPRSVKNICKKCLGASRAHPPSSGFRSTPLLCCCFPSLSANVSPATSFPKPPG